MEEVRVAIPTNRTEMSEIRPDLDEALANLLAPGWLESRWEGDILHLEGPGAEATVHLESGQLIGQARLGPPASLMRSVIEEKVTRLLRRVATADPRGAR